MSSSKENRVASFAVDHTTLRQGVYLRSSHKDTLSWDIRMRAPSENRSMTAGAVHVLEHTLAQGLREVDGFGDKVIALCPMGCLTGLYLITDNDVEIKDVLFAIREVAFMYFPLLEKDDVPGLNTRQCGNPYLADVGGANTAMREFINAINRKHETDSTKNSGVR